MRYGQIGFAVANPSGPRGRGAGHLQPVDADRLAVARLGAVADVDEIAGLQHLPAGLGEARLVAVGRRGR